MNPLPLTPMRVPHISPFVGEMWEMSGSLPETSTYKKDWPENIR
jgi:hypothetical protein